MCLGAGHPMGPLQLADYVGLDTCLSILQGGCAQYPDEPAFFVPPSLTAKVREGKLGRKSGEGATRGRRAGVDEAVGGVGVMVAFSLSHSPLIYVTVTGPASMACRRSLTLTAAGSTCPRR